MSKMDDAIKKALDGDSEQDIQDFLLQCSNCGPEPCAAEQLAYDTAVAAHAKAEGATQILANVKTGCAAILQACLNPIEPPPEPEPETTPM